MDTPPPQLRHDLILHHGSAEPDGAPTWTLYDPAGNRFFRIGWFEFECLSRFETHKTFADVLRSINLETALDVTFEEIFAFSNFLIMSELVVVKTTQASNELAVRGQRQKKSFWKKILHSYLFFILPLVNPDRFLRWAFPFVAPIFTKKFFTAILFLLAFGIYLTIKRWDEFLNTAINFFSWEGLFFYIIALAFVKILHELSHAFMAVKQGVRVSSMGVAFIVLYPVLFTETTGAWKLSDRRGRLLIGAAGILAELCIAAVALIVWHISPDGMVRSTAFFMASVSLAGSLLINLNPFMRFDGYYLLGDALGVDNLQARSFALAKWNMRKILLGWREIVPEIFNRSLHLILLFYAYGTWIYRFFLFLGIAILVYVLFFKPLGLFLMGVELVVFLGLPIYREIKIWVKDREKMNWNKRGRIFVLFLGIVCFMFIVPWRGSIDIPAIVMADSYRNLHASVPAYIEKLYVAQGEEIQKGDILIKLISPDLDQKILAASQNLQALKRQKLREETSKKLVRHRSIMERLIAQAQSLLVGYEEQRQRLEMRAPFDGYVSDIAPNIHSGRWVGEDIALIKLVDPDQSILYGYVHETDVAQIHIGNEGVFYPDNGGVMSPLRVKMMDLGKNNAVSLSHPDFSSFYGGALAVQEGGKTSGENMLLPRDTLYAVTFTPSEGGSHSGVPPYLLRGHVRLEGERQSALMRFFRSVSALVIRESGF